MSGNTSLGLSLPANGVGRPELVLFSYVPFWSTKHINNAAPRVVVKGDIEDKVNSMYDAHVPDVAAILYGFRDDALTAAMVVDRADELFDDMHAWSEHDIERFFTVVCGSKEDGGYYFQLVPNLEESVNRLCSTQNINRDEYNLRIIYRGVLYDSAPGHVGQYNLLKEHRNVSICFIDSKNLKELKQILESANVGAPMSTPEDWLIDVGTFALSCVEGKQTI